MRTYFLLLFVLCAGNSIYAQNYFAGTNAGNGTSGGVDNTSIGTNAGDVVTGSNNVFFGKDAGKVNTSGYNNTFLGYRSGYSNVSGNFNCYVGYQAGYLSTGSYNVSIGYEAGYSSTGSNNVYYGYRAGKNNVSGSGNIFIGKEAGLNETGSNKLYIDNSSTSAPLILGDFAANQVAVNATLGTYTLNVGGSLNATDVYVGNQPYRASLWETAGSNIVFPYSDGIVGIGVAALADHKLAVGGKIITTEIVTKQRAQWPDYVFDPTYKLRSLESLQKYIDTHHHLPEVPSATEVEEEGIDLAQVNAALLKKIEELNLYLIDLNKKIKEFEQQKNSK